MPKQKVSLKGKSDFGLPPVKDGEEPRKAGGGTFDPFAFKGNAQLFVHFNEQALAKLNRRMNKSDSLKKKKKLKHTFGDDYNTSLPDEVLAEIHRFRE